MNFTCNECNDSGSRDKLGTYLDCNACGTAATRRDLNDFVKSLGPTHPEDVALAIHQRALAMAPKQEAPIGYISSLALIELQDPDAPDNILTLRHSKSKHPRCEIAVYIEAQPAPESANGAMPELPEPTIDGTVYHTEHKICYVAPVHFTADQMRAYGKACAAAGPDAALPGLELAAEQLAEYCENMGYHNSYVDDVRAALSGAKGN